MCYCLTVDVSQTDIESAAGNIETGKDGKVFLDYKSCDYLSSSKSYSSAGVYLKDVCSSGEEVMYYYKDNVKINTTKLIEEGCCCNKFDVNVMQADINDATGNTDGGVDEKVYVEYMSCNGYKLIKEYPLAGYYSQDICGKTPQMYYYKEDNKITTTEVKENGWCCSPTPTPTPTPTSTPNPTPTPTPIV